MWDPSISTNKIGSLTTIHKGCQGKYLEEVEPQPERDRSRYFSSSSNHFACPRFSLTPTPSCQFTSKFQRGSHGEAQEIDARALLFCTHLDSCHYSPPHCSFRIVRILKSFEVESSPTPSKFQTKTDQTNSRAVNCQVSKTAATELQIWRAGRPMRRLSARCTLKLLLVLEPQESLPVDPLLRSGVSHWRLKILPISDSLPVRLLAL